MSNRITDDMNELAACFAAQWEADDPDRPCFVTPLPGEAFDPTTVLAGCDNNVCGMGYVRLGTFYPSNATGVVDEEPGNANKSFSYELLIGMVRCFPEHEDGNTPEELATAVTLQNDDILAMVKAVRCCFRGDREQDYILQAYTPEGPLGQMVGGFMTVIVSFL